MNTSIHFAAVPSESPHIRRVELRIAPHPFACAASSVYRTEDLSNAAQAFAQTHWVSGAVWHIDVPCAPLPEHFSARELAASADAAFICSIHLVANMRMSCRFALLKKAIVGVVLVAAASASLLYAEKPGWSFVPLLLGAVSLYVPKTAFSVRIQRNQHVVAAFTLKLIRWPFGGCAIHKYFDRQDPLGDQLRERFRMSGEPHARALLSRT